MKLLSALAAVACLTVATTANAAGTLTLDSVILGGVQNDLVISLSGTPLVNTELSGTIDISGATGDGTEITGFEIGGGLITTTDTVGLIALTGVEAEPNDTAPGLNPVVGGDFDAADIGLSINNGTADILAFGLSFDFSTDPISGPGSGTGTIVVNSVSGDDYDVTITLPIALVLEVTTGVTAGVDGLIVASGTITTTAIPEPTSGLFLASLAAGAGAVVRRRRK